MREIYIYIYMKEEKKGKKERKGKAGTDGEGT